MFLKESGKLICEAQPLKTFPKSLGANNIIYVKELADMFWVIDLSVSWSA